MNNKIKFLASLPIILTSLWACGGTTSSEYVPQTELEIIFDQLTNNNFTVDYYGSFLNNNNVPINEKYYYTDYSCQAEGDLGFSGLAQADDVVFRYNLVDGEVVSGAPLINYNTGIRYGSIYDYTYGMQSFDVSYLPKTKDDDGWYTYRYGRNLQNDITFMAVFLKEGYGGFFPEQTRIRVVQNIIMIETIILSYDWEWEDEIYYDTVTTIVSDIGTTQNLEIKQYLEDGKTSKESLDLNFFKFIQPYLSSHNYTIHLDATGMKNQDFVLTEYCTDNAVLDVTDDGYKSGYLLTQGYVSSYQILNDKIEITDTPMYDSTTFYTDIYSDLLGCSFTDITYDMLIGYKDNENDSVYYLTENQVVTYLAYICYITLSEEMACDVARIEITDKENHDFTLYFDLYNKTTNTDLGTYTAKFSNLNKTVIPEVDRYFNTGALPSSQTKDDLREVLDLFKTGCYSMDSMTSAGMAKIYFTPNYFYEELYQNPDNNFGRIRIDDEIYGFNLVDGKVVLESNTSYDINLPGCGSYYGGADDLGYISHFDDEFYNLDNYAVEKVCGEEVWRITNKDLSRSFFDYYYGSSSIIFPLGTGIKVSKGSDPYDTRLTVLSSIVASDGSYETTFSYTYYDIGNTSHPIVDAYLNSL